jgi:hypothetical protein
MRKIIAFIALALSFGSQVLANDDTANREWEKSQTVGMVSMHGAYRNTQYGFSIPVIVAKMYRPAPPNPNHGMLAILGNQREISVSGEFDAAEYGSTKSALDHSLENEHADSIKRESITLAGRPAEQATLRVGTTITKVVEQRRDEHGGIIYELTLTTTQEHQAEDSALFDRILQSFKTTPL